ncbi:Methyltransferase type 11 [Sphingomonas sp. EC-HK361]|uniref:methyltransferase domain-containing protein n=1 Tax=Sphingomonas sp. EC-HK361 TaxID=2038397 RepID=UPI001251D241|nr:methyltransferase domain-containing protein [Sphingomonas sp. EC-HK361]VVT13531.1 Methyltransferase type 11 [Sphingomonas sp. EC-HK361]
MTDAEIFDRNARRRSRDRAAPSFADHDFLRAAMIEGLVDRLASVKRAFVDMLDLGCFDGSVPAPDGARVARLDPGFAFARSAGAVQADEDRPPFADASFDLIVSAGVLDTVNDLPGALLLARRMLRPDGLFLAAFLGAPSLPTLRAALRSADADEPAPHLHPQVDVRAAGDLLSRAGFALPVADSETLDVRYPHVGRLVKDLRGMAGGNLLPGRRPFTRERAGRLAEAFQSAADPDGRVAERFTLLFLTGWSPSPDQPKPAKRGSGVTSLVHALGPGGVRSGDQ